MGKMLAALLHLQKVERQVVEVRGRLRARQNAVAAEQRRIDQLRKDWQGLHDESLGRRKECDSFELDLKVREEKVASLRGVLNTAKTNKEYAAILTQINSLKADNAKLEEKALKVMQEIDNIKAEAGKVQVEIETEQKHLAQMEASSSEEISRLNTMLEHLAVERTDAAAEVESDHLAMFERIAEKLDGDAMAAVEIHGQKPPYSYVCGGCFMSLNAEHTNALRSRDEIRTCDSCGRILYLETSVEAEHEQ